MTTTQERTSPPQYRGGPRGAGPPPGGRPRGRYAPRRRVCEFCVQHAKSIDYKEVDRLRRYISDRAKIEPPRKTGVCARHQRMLTTAIKRARHLAMLAFVPGHIISSGIRYQDRQRSNFQRT
jgi:small subunit ribosomal protein S18